MLVGEALFNRKFLIQKINDLSSYIKTHNVNDFLSGKNAYNDLNSALFKFLDELRSYNILINESNNNTVIKIDNSEISVNRAIEMRNTLQSKVDLFTDLISKGDMGPLGLIDQRDGLIKELTYISSLISLSDWSTKVD